MAEVKIQVFEWKIENFSCWCEAVHKSIDSPDFHDTSFKKAELFARGSSDQDDHLNVRFCDVQRDFTGELSFIGFDGSSICTQQLKITQKGERVYGPSVAQIRGKTYHQKDQITLRFCIHSDKDYEQHMCTTIDVWKLSFEIDTKSIKNLQSTKSKELSYFRYISEEKKDLHMKIVRLNERIQLIMEPYDKEEKAVLIEICVSMLSSDNFLVRNEVVKHVFIDGEAWIFSESLTVKELEEKGIIIHLQLKVINGDFFDGYNYIIKDKIMSILVQNESTNCLNEHLPSKSTASSNKSDDSSTELKKELMCLFQDQDFSDFRLKCGDVSFPVHKNILSARSPVFKTMLLSDMKEATSSEVDIEDLDPSTLGLFLTYLYTGAVEELEVASALKLYYAADKYQVPFLKKECADFLCKQMSIENVCDVLTLADKHKDEGLTAVSHNFILNMYNDIVGSKQWEIFMESDPILASKTLTHFAKKNQVGKKHIP